MVWETIVSFRPSSVGSFHAVLWITFSDNGRQFKVTRQLRGRAILPGGSVINGGATYYVEDMEEGEGAGITISHDFGLEFFLECPWFDEPFAT